MVLGFLSSSVENLFPKEPAVLTSNGDSKEQKSIPDIIKESVPELSSGYWYWVNPLLRTGHAQTAYTALREFPDVDTVHYKRQILTIDLKNKFYSVDGEKCRYDQWDGKSTIAVDYVVPESSLDADHLKFKPDSQTDELPPRTEFLDPSKELELFSEEKPLLIALHGLSGGSYESYLRSVLFQITKPEFGFDALVLNARGCASHTITSPQLFCGLWTNDLRYLINEHILKKWPLKRIYLVGFSLGGAITVNYLGQEGEDVPANIKGAAVLGTPWDFNDSSIQLQHSIIGNSVYSPKMCSNLMKLLKRHTQGGFGDVPEVSEYIKNSSKLKVSKLVEFDDLFTSRLFGFNCASEYYRLASPVTRLMKVRVPLFMINSYDDPITGWRTLPFSEVKLNPYVNLITTTRGGHLGYFAYNGERWYPRPLSKLFKELDINWSLDKSKIPQESLPLDITKTFRYDRII